MKKLLVAIVALSTVSAFAGTDNMVRVYGWDSGDRAMSFDVSTFKDDQDKAQDDMTIAVNYARAFGQWQVGLTYVSKKETTDGDVDAGSYTKTGLSGYYNMESDLLNTCYLALHYNMTSYADDATTSSKDGDKNTDIVLEYGHRFSVGSGWGFNVAYAPNVMYTMSTYAPDAGDDVASSSLAWNFLKFDVLF